MPDIHVWLGDAEPGTVNVILHAGTPPAEPAAEPGDAVAAMLRREWSRTAAAGASVPPSRPDGPAPVPAAAQAKSRHQGRGRPGIALDA